MDILAKDLKIKGTSDPLGAVMAALYPDGGEQAEIEATLAALGLELLESGQIEAARALIPAPAWQEKCLWYHVNQLYRSERLAKGWDDNATPRALAFLSDPSCPAWRRARIEAVTAWGDSAWQLYYMVKTQIGSGQGWELPSLPEECPHHFYEILFE